MKPLSQNHRKFTCVIMPFWLIPFFDGPRDKNVFKLEMQEVLRKTKERFRKAIKKTNSANEVESSERNLDNSESEENLENDFDESDGFGNDELE